MVNPIDWLIADAARAHGFNGTFNLDFKPHQRRATGRVQSLYKGRRFITLWKLPVMRWKIRCFAKPPCKKAGSGIKAGTDGRAISSQQGTAHLPS
jgi:hypothetical protein